MLPERTLDSMSDAIAMSSPNGRMSNRAKDAASKRLAESLFGPGGLTREEMTGTPSEEQKRAGKIAQIESMLRTYRAIYPKQLASTRPNKVRQEYDRMQNELAGLMNAHE